MGEEAGGSCDWEMSLSKAVVPVADNFFSQSCVILRHLMVDIKS